jgi:signal transduction histidine kinase
MTRCETIITEMLDFARAKGLQLESTPLDQWLADVLDEYEAGPDVAMSRHLGCGGLVLEIDRDALRRAIFNILDNACQAMAQDREGTANHEISVTTRAVPGKAELIFRDNGPGISADILPDVMEPLFSTKSFGTGLGLPTVKRIMDDHRGAIEIASQPHGGACITLSLPTHKRHE